LRYAITPLTTMLVSAEVVEDTFRFAEPSRATTRSYLYLGGFEFGQKAVLNGRLLAGVRDIPARSAGGVVPYTGPAVRGSLLVPILQQRVRIGADLTRDVYYSATALRAEDEPLRNTYTYGQWRLTLEFDLPVGFIGRVIAGWQDAEYHVPIVIDDVTMLREDRLRRLGGSLLRRLGRNARFGLTAVHSTRSSNVPGLAYTRWQYGVQAELTP
jgi:hypothetical protein